jgi:hypothetical protein
MKLDMLTLEQNFLLKLIEENPIEEIATIMEDSLRK